jgi:hypothetical protein
VIFTVLAPYLETMVNGGSHSMNGTKRDAYIEHELIIRVEWVIRTDWDASPK